MRAPSGSPVPASLIAVEIAAGNQIGTPILARRLKVSLPTLFRWISKGLPDGKGNRVRLEAVRVGVKWLTSQSAVERFFAKLEHTRDADQVEPAAPARPNRPGKTRTPAERETAADDARRQH